MTNRDLLKEAIADAKAVKETAIANAKAALEEAFTPHLQSMLASRLQEMEKEEDLEENVEMYEEDVTEEVEEAKEKMMGMKKKENMEEEINLDELLAELEETETLNEVEEEEESEEEETEEEEEMMEPEMSSLEDMSEEDLKAFIEDVIQDMIAAGELEAGEASMMGSEDEMESEEEEEEINIDELLAEMGSEDDKDDMYEMKKKKMMGDEKMEEMKMKMMKKEKELEEAYNTIKEMKSQISEVNLLNAKLLYTNKIFKSKNLSESQKMKVLSNFDKATTVKEVKLVYESLNENLTVSAKSSIKENLGSASKPMGIAKKEQIIELDPVVSRFQKLAGIN